MDYPYLAGDRTKAFAHRGGNTEAPENTMASFSHAVSIGYRYLETDVHLSRDGHLVAFHDPDLSRLVGHPGSISDYTWNEIREIELADGHYIPDLEELLVAFPGCYFNIDPKSDETVWPLVSTIREHGAIDRVGIGSFSDDRITTMQEIMGPRLCTSPGPNTASRIVARAYGLGRVDVSKYGCLQIPPSKGLLRLNRSMVIRIQRLGLEVHVWTINDAGTMNALLDMGVDAIMTDDTELLKSVMLDRGVWSAS